MVPIASRNQRSWETATIVLGEAASARSSTSSVSKSRWLVGSSSSSRSASEATMAAIAARARWPGLRRSSGRRTASASRPKWASSVRARDSSTPARGVAAEPRQQRAGRGEVLRALGQQADARRHLDVAGARLQRPEQEAQQRRLPRPVGAGDRDPVAAVEREVEVLEHAGVDAPQRRDAGAAVGGGVEPEAHRRGLARALDPGLRRSSRARAGARAPSPSWRPSSRSGAAGRRPGRWRCARRGGRGRGCRRCRP